MGKNCARYELKKDRALTPKELEALRLAADGMNSVDIARVWGHSETKRNRHHAACNVRRHWKNAADKLGADNTVQAVAMAIRRGLIQ